MKNTFLILVIFLFTIRVFAQDPLANNFELYSKVKTNGKLFVHYDKNVYAVNEMVWFTGYLINSIDVSKHKLLSVSLVRESDNKVVFEDRFEMKNGLAFGTIAIPDSVSVGNYRLLAITDYTINGKPEVSFTQFITVKSEIDPPFKTRMNVLSVNGNKQRIVVYSTGTNNKFLDKPVDVTYRYGGVQNTVKSDKAGRAVIDLEYLHGLNDPTLYVKSVHANDSTFVNLTIKEESSTPIVQFFPEGGNIISNLSNRVGWEVKDSNKQSLSLTAYLLKNNVRIDTLKSDNFGMGSFDLFAEEGSKYSLQIVGNKGFKDTVYSLPVFHDKGVVLHVPTAVSSEDVVVYVRSKEQQEVYLRIHNFNSIFISTKLELKPGQRGIRIPMSQLPKGIASITITDSENRPLAERLIFAHYDKRADLLISTDKNEYKTREKVTLKINPKGITNTSVVSVAVVQDNRFEQGKMTDIENFTFLSSQLANVPPMLSGDAKQKLQYLENILLIKGWRSYKWSDLAAVSLKDSVLKHANLRYSGQVVGSKRKLNDGIELGVMFGQNIKMIEIDKDGKFDFNSPDIHAEIGRKLSLFVNKNKNERAYRLVIDNELLKASQLMVNKINSDYRPPLLSQADNSLLLFNIGEKAIQIEEVLVKAQVVRGALGPNACGDYVCFYNVLNCSAHYTDKRNTSPITGRKYKYYGAGRGQETIVYPGCTAAVGQDRSLFMEADGVHLNKVFYTETYSDPNEPAFYSTIYWNHALILNKDKEASVEFYTGDIVGKYRVILQGVQGVGQNEVVSGQQVFEVK